MDAVVAVLASLVLTSLMLMLMLGLAWASFGRPRHALFWAGMFAARALAWGINLGSRLQPGGSSHSAALIDGLGVLGSLLLLLGFRARAGLPLRLRPLGALAGGCFAVTVLGAGVRAGELVALAPVLAFTAFCAGSAAVLLLRERDAGPVPRAAGGAMMLFALVYGGTALLSAGAAPFAPAMVTPLRLLVLIGVPAAATGAGLLCLLLIAGDLAQAMRRLAWIDPLTGIFNRRGLEQAAGALLALCHRQGQPLSIVIADLDRFKAINDRFGHAVGDVALQAFARHAADQLRRGDIVARLGGEEFAILLANAAPEQARDAIERLRAGMAGIAADRIAPLALSCSFGIAAVAPQESAIAAALERADQALYASKRDGRDRITVAAPPPARPRAAAA